MTARALADARRPDGEGARADWMAVTMARLMGQRVLAVERAEAAAGRHAESLVLRYELAASLWDNGERARTSDLLTEVAEAAGPDLPYFGLQQARFWQQSDLKEKARARMQALRDAHPDRTSAWLRLAEAFRAESWEEDQCAALRAVLERTPNWPRVALDLGLCLEDLRFYPRAQAIYKEVRESLPNSHRALTRLHWHAQGNDEFVAAERYARELTRHWPHLQDSWLRLAETLRRAGDRAGAEAALESAIAIDPDDPVPHRRLAALAYQAGEVEPAVERWRAALERAPEDARLANRLAWLAPAAQGPWAADVPDEAALVEAVARRNTIAPLPGADVIYLLDDEVTRLNPDGSTINVVTMVAHAVNERGRDRLTRSSIRGGGRTRVLHAYAVDPDGRRLEASSIRGRSVRFRGLSVGSTVVLQYRLDARPDGYLDRYMARQWWFQAPGTQAAVSRWVVWAPAGTGFLDEGRGDYARTVDERGDLVRGEWRKDDNPPVITEPGMPTLSEVAAHVVVSTVPGWDLFWKWEEALLRDAFRVSPELRALAAELFEGTESASEKIRRLQTYLMTDIRYQQDYEGHIAGVKPHAAPMVVARQYGDCKDKAVLFITLARLGGVEAHYALVRTRDAGPVRRAVPMQQFNHAIVYVPAQGDFAEGRFMDPTVDALDVDVLRRDDQGVWALVHDPAGGTHEWRRIPFQDASVDWTRSTMALQLASDGSATLDIDLLAHGQVGAVLRTTARNPERLAQLMQKQMTQSFAGAQVLGHTPMELADVRTPARVQVAARAPNVARVEDDTLRLRAPISWRPEGWFALAERRHPLLLGVPRTLSWDVELGLPDGARLKRVPEDAKVSTTCLSLERAYSEEDGRLRVKQTVQFLCERIPVEQYGAHRAEVEAMTRVLDAEIVVTLGKRRGRATARR
jgi:tetratricopeptide (TPR) repeat protein/transglutaminase-like putative cysteine protease